MTTTTQSRAAQRLTYRTIDSPVGRLTLAGNGTTLTRLVIQGQRHQPDRSSWHVDHRAFPEAVAQLRAYNTGADLVQFQGPQLIGDECRGVDLPVGQLGVLMKKPAPGDHLGGDSTCRGVQTVINSIVRQRTSPLRSLRAAADYPLTTRERRCFLQRCARPTFVYRCKWLRRNDHG